MLQVAKYLRKNVNIERKRVLVIEDEPEVRDAIIRDLEPLRSTVRIEAAEDIRDARSALLRMRI